MLWLGQVQDVAQLALPACPLTCLLALCAWQPSLLWLNNLQALLLPLCTALQQLHMVQASCA